MATFQAEHDLANDYFHLYMDEKGLSSTMFLQTKQTVFFITKLMTKLIF